MTPPRPSASTPASEIVQSTRRLHAATLVAAMVSSARRPHSITEILQLEAEVLEAAYPSVGVAQAGAAGKGDERLPKVAPSPVLDGGEIAGGETGEGDDRSERSFGRREEPPQLSAIDEEALQRVYSVLNRHGGDAAGAQTPQSLISAQEAVRRMRAAALSAAAATGGGGEAHAEDGADASRGERLIVETRRRRRAAVTGLTVACGVLALGAWQIQRPIAAAEGRPRVVQAAIPRKVAQAGPAPASAGALVDGPDQTLRAAVALAPTVQDSPRASHAESPKNGAAETSRLYSAAVAEIAAGQKQGLKTLRRIARLGYAPAQFYLAKLCLTGADGMTKDVPAARRWTERAAEGGEVKAMHNLALYFLDGTGGPRDTVAAATWFHRAADQGLIDSQFNLGQLYERGVGVPKNPAEALKWYAIASRAGDSEAGVAAARLRNRISAQAAAVASRSAEAFHPTGPVGAAPTPTSAPTNPLSTAQRALSQLGYYQGPADGAASPALRMALAAYQRDHGLSPTGTTDAATAAKLFALER